MIALFVIWILYRLLISGSFRQLLFAALGFVFFVSLGAIINYHRYVAPTLERVVGIITPEKTENGSSLVYLQGWQDALFNLQRTNGLGLGLNMMGCNPLPNVSAREKLSNMNWQLNSEDGSFLFSKLISETGVIGLLFFGIVMWWWVKLEQHIRKCNNATTNYTSRIQLALLFCFIVPSLLRSAGYFDGILFFLVVAIAGSTTKVLAKQ